MSVFILSKSYKERKEETYVMLSTAITEHSHKVSLVLEWFSNDCLKTKTKAITMAKHNRNNQRNELITIPGIYL